MSAANARVGALAGLLGGVVMAMWSMVALAATGAGFWTPVNLIAHTIWRGAPIDGSFSVGALLLGLMVHMAMSVVFGVILAALVGRLAGTLGALLGVGMAFGLAVWLVNQYVLWPAIDQTAAQAFTPWVLAVGHLLFGLVAAVLLGRLPAHRGLGRQLPGERFLPPRWTICLPPLCGPGMKPARPTERSSISRMAAALSRGSWTKQGLPWRPKPMAFGLAYGPS